ncbi:hypothetical protein ES705_47182 [subsurface metagenome]
MAIDLEEIFRSLNEILPYIAKQKMRLDQERKIMQMYLNKRLTEYGALEEMGKRGRAEKYDYASMLKFLGSILKGTEELDRPGMAGRMRASELGIPVPLAEVSPEQYGEAGRPYGEMAATMAGAKERGEYLPVEKMGLATQLFGSKRFMDYVEEVEKIKAGREQRKISKEKTKLGWAELGVKGEKLTKKQLEEKLKYFGKKEKVFVDELESLEEEIGLLEDAPRAENLITQRDEMRENILNTLDQLLGDLDKKKCDGIISKLRANKINTRVLEKNKKDFMKEENLTDAEYQYIRLNL